MLKEPILEYKITNIERVFGYIKGKEKGPTVIFFAGIHGNETAGVVAIIKVLQQLAKYQNTVSGKIIALAGNINAIQKGVRYAKEDLNRIWLPERIESINNELSQDFTEDEREMSELYKVLQKIIKTESPPFYFVDLHTTSGKTSPFIVVNDSLLNRKFVANYPLPKILGIEEYLHGALLSYMNELGYVAFGFESGQHNSEDAVVNAMAFIKYTLQITCSVNCSKKEIAYLKSTLQNMNTVSNSFYEIKYQYEIGDKEVFKMRPGFLNFQQLPKNRFIAYSNGEKLITTKKRQIFMPLYQSQGKEGFYFIKRIPLFFLWLSKYLRKLRIDYLLVHMPGISWKSEKREVLKIDLKTARFLAKSILHLLGYRVRHSDATHILAKSREGVSKTVDYKTATWFVK